MNSIADMGGMHGFGAVVPERGEPVFHQDWERRVCGLAMTIAFWTFDEGRFSIESMPPGAYLETSYYEHWLYAAETLLVRKGVLTPQELEAGRPSSPTSVPASSKPMRKEQCWPAFRAGGSIAMPTDRAARFRVGDAVVARNLHPAGHTRLPRYARGHRGTVVACRGSFGFADTRAHGLGDHPQHLYTVRFEGRELWGEDGGARDAIHLDLYESYLEPPA
jgi:nitrile hydratase